MQLGLLQSKLHSWQAHLERICHYLIYGEGVWWDLQLRITLQWMLQSFRNKTHLLIHLKRNMQLPVKYKTCNHQQTFPMMSQLPINNCRRELFNDEESEVCQGSEVSQDNAQIAHAENKINPTILEPIGLNSRTALAIYSITKTMTNDLKLFDNLQNNFKKKSNFHNKNMMITRKYSSLKFCEREQK